jgi:hypothetical protein
MAIAADGSTEGLRSPCCSRKRVVLVWSGIVGQGVLGLGAVCRGRPIAADGSKEGASLPCCSLRRADMVRLAWVGQPLFWPGPVWPGTAWSGMLSPRTC